MIVIKGADALVAVMLAAVTTTAPTYSTTFAEVASADLTAITDASSEKGSLNGTTPVNIVAAPGGTDERDIKYMHFHNADTVSHTVRVTQGSTVIFQFTMVAGGSATYSAEHGWIVYSADGAPSTSPTAHAATHENGGADEISVLGLSGLLADGQTPLAHKTSHENGGADEISVAGLSGLLADGQTPLGHNTSHQSGGSDAIKLDDLAAPDDNTDLNASASAHGLLPKLSNVATEYLDGTGAFSTPAGGGGGDIVVADPGFTTDLEAITLDASEIDITSDSVVLAAGDILEIEVWGTIRNNSGAGRVYTTRIDIGGTKFNTSYIGSLGGGSTLQYHLELRTRTAIGANDAYRHGGKLRLATAGAAFGAGAIASTNRVNDWEGAGDLTGTKTVKFTIQSNNGTAGQTFKLAGYTIRVIPQTP